MNGWKQCERMVEEICKAYMSLGLADIGKIEVKQLHVNGRTIYAKRTRSDFEGVIHPVGGGCPLPVRIECKFTSDPKLSLAANGLKSHQVDGLADWDTRGYLAVVAWLHGPEMRVLRPSAFPVKGKPARFDDAEQVARTQYGWDVCGLIK